MSKLLTATAFSVIFLIILPLGAGFRTATSALLSVPTSGLQTRVLQDKDGNVHVLVVMSGANDSLTGPGIWYTKYSVNGTVVIPPTKITNSTTVQSADLSVDNHDNGIVVWADDNASSVSLTSAIYLLRFNGTRTQQSRLLSTHRSLLLWPSLGGGENDTIYVTWTAYTPSTQHAIIEYGIITRIELSFESPIASYDEVGVFPPKASVIFENMSEPLQIAWGESQANGGYNSTSGVYYAMLGSNGTVLNKFQIAETQAPLRDVSITPIAGQGGAFVTWETQAANASVYVSQISARGQLSYVRELNYTTGESKFLTVSMYSDGNLFVMWYQPSVATAGASTSVTQSTNVSYFRLNLDGAIVQAGSGSFSVPIMGVTVLNDGAVYGVAPDRLVRAVSPVQKQQNNLLALGAIALMSCIGAAGFAGSVVVEDWRYRWVALYSRIASRISKESPSARHRIIRLLARKPGLKLREIKRASGDHPIDITSLVRMEKDGLLASFQDGLSRRFYLKDTEIGKADALRTRILLWVLEHPGIWEAQLAKELGLSQQIVHYHLKKLRETKMITSGTDSSGIRKFYRFVDGSHDAVKQ